jgi:hypothetical protein
MTVTFFQILSVSGTVTSASSLGAWRPHIDVDTSRQWQKYSAGFQTSCASRKGRHRGGTPTCRGDLRSFSSRYFFASKAAPRREDWSRYWYVQSRIQSCFALISASFRAPPVTKISSTRGTVREISSRCFRWYSHNPRTIAARSSSRPLSWFMPVNSARKSSRE